MPIPAPIYIDGRPGSVSNPSATGKASMNVASASGAPRYGHPFDGDPGAYTLNQEFMQMTVNYAPLALSTAHPDYPTYLLTSESALQDMGGGVSKWNRTYCQVPATRNDWASISYAFIGYYGAVAIAGVGAGTAPAIGRPRDTYVVPCRIQNDYFLIGPTQTYTDPSQIPRILAQKYYWQQGHTVVTAGIATWVPTYVTGSTQDLNAGTDTDFIWDSALWSSVVPTIPNRATYQTWINNGTEIVVSTSVVSRWKGNIYQRQTRYVVAQ